MHSFVSTRGADEASVVEAVLRGLARDGGLYVPARLGRLPDTTPPSTGLVEVARWSAPALVPGVASELVERAVVDSLTFPMPLVEVDAGVHVLELHHGPTHAFKDVGARFLARLAKALEPTGRRRTVLVATSGDTGGAVADAFHRVDPFRVVVLFPRDGVSARQRRQMTTLGDNVTALSVDGTFDDCQRLAKAAFLDDELSEEHGLMSANSINVGRLLPQAFYYVYAASLLGWDAPARFVVPSGNLGNLCAGLIAHRMGMPASGFVAASNANRGFVDFLEGGRFEPRAAIRTASNAMDVGSPSNLERILWLYGGDVAALRRDVAGISVTDDETRAVVRDVHRRHGYVLDPHSAVAYAARLRHDGASSGSTVVLATAHPAKFPELTEDAIGRALPLPEGLSRAQEGEEHMTEVAPSLAALRGALEEVVA